MKDTKRSRGRPSVYHVETARAIAASIAEGASKKEACEKPGVAYASFMRWQRQKRSLQRLLEEAADMWRDNQRIERDLKVLLSEEPAELDNCSHRHNMRPYREHRDRAEVNFADEARGRKLRRISRAKRTTLASQLSR